ncbi:MAG TPA: CoA-binding protein [Lentisphaeria bacterium]|nr:MAG: hypothetical protein A2X47_04315 [Lentisphaerae bacterium GWF2_38_69]HBM16215.1 CoA-binding protein [Lentisphaeria bacterium]
MNAGKNSNIVVLGASNKPEKYSYMAVDMLKSHGFNVIPVHPSGISVCNLDTKRSLLEINASIDTLSIYVNSSLSSRESEAILKLNPRRIIFNPGTENPSLENICSQKGIEVIHACTLVLLRTSSF